MRSAAFVVVLAVLAVGAGAQSAFNEEISKRTTETLDAFLYHSVVLNRQLQAGFLAGSMLFDDELYLRKYMYSQMAAAESEIGAVSVGATANGQFISFERDMDGSPPYTIIRTDSASTACPSVPAPCVTRYPMDNFTALGAVGDMPFMDVRGEDWFTSAQGSNDLVWSEPELGSNGLGLRLSGELRDSSGAVGVSEVYIALGEIGDFLEAELTTDNRTVFIMDLNAKLVATSVPGLVTVGTGPEARQVLANETSHEPIRTAALFIQDKPVDVSQSSVSIHEGDYIQVTPYINAMGVNWTVVVLQTLEVKNDHIKTGTVTFFIVVVLACAGALSVLAVAYMLVTTPAGTAWEPLNLGALWFLMLCYLAADMSGFAMLGETTDETCQLRMWFPAVTVTAGIAALGLLTDYAAWYGPQMLAQRKDSANPSASQNPAQRKDSANPSASQNPASSGAGAAAASASGNASGGAASGEQPSGGDSGVAVVHESAPKGLALAILTFAVSVGVQVGLCGLWTAVSPLEATDVLDTASDGSSSLRVRCRSDESWPAYLCLVWLVLVTVRGAFVSHKPFKLGGGSRARALGLCFYHATVILLIVVVAAVAAGVTDNLLYFVLTLAVNWFTATSLALLVLPTAFAAYKPPEEKELKVMASK